MQTFIASVVVFGLLIFFHELGHFTVAKLSGVKVYEFSLGFGPRLVGINGKETNYNLRLLPLGGFVRMAGMDPGDDDEEVIDEQNFNKKPVWKRVAIIVAGPLMNFVLAALLLALVFTLQGIPTATNEVGQVLSGYPAAEAGLRGGDVIVAIDGKQVGRWDQLVDQVNAHPGQKLDLTVVRSNRQLHLTVSSKKDENGQYKIGISPAKTVLQKLNPLSALAAGFQYTVQVTGLILTFLGKMFRHQAPVDLGGPVRVVSEISKAAKFGAYQVLQLAAFLSINLGLFNLFPIPALDGSRVLFLAWEKVTGKPVEPAKESFIHLIGFGLLLVLMVVVTYNDIVSLVLNK